MDLIMPDPGTFVWTGVIFLVLYWLLAKYAWPQILEALRLREEGIASDIDAAKKARDEVEESLKTLEERLENARQEAAAIIDEGRADAERLRGEFIAVQEKDADALRSRVAREIGLAKEKAVDEIREMAIGLSFDLSRRILEEDLQGNHEALVNRLVTQFEKKSEGQSEMLP
jgi:F-type H+-transporting ATPase subunit b